MKVNLKKAIRIPVYRIFSLFSKPNTKAIFIFGNQKSGTSAIAALLASLGERSVSIDINTLLPSELKRLHAGKLSFPKFIRRHAFEFSKDIIKEPWLTLFYEQLKNYFELEKSVFVVRDPRDNIRSILNRLKIPGDLESFNNWQEIPGLWRMALDNRWLGVPYEHYIESMAGRWVLMNKIYLDHPAKFVLARYEDFIQDKVGYIEFLASQVGIPSRKDIRHLIDKQFQPRGQRNVSWTSFFGEKNLERIERICGPTMQQLGYEPLLTKNV